MFGRFLRANRDITAGTVIVNEPPSVVGPKWTSDDEDLSVVNFSCVGCFSPIKFLNCKCPGCHWPACSYDCVGLTNPELHDIECVVLKIGRGPACRTDIRAINEYYRTDSLLALKILLLQRKNPKKFKGLMEMESNEKNRLMTFNFREAEERINHLEENFLNPLKKCEEKSGQVILPEKDKKILHKIFGIMETNAMYINLPTGREICGLYPTACLMEHSCLPNCSYDFDMKNGFKITVQAARDIKAGEHLTTTYSHVLWSTQLRQQHLKDSKYFNCVCERCKDPSELGTNFSSLRCMGTEESPCNGLQLPVDPTSPESEWACNKCQITVASDQVSFIHDRMNEEIEGILASVPSPKDLEELLGKLENFLHPTHYHMFTVKHALLQLYGTHKESPIESLKIEKLNKKLEMCDELLKVTQSLDQYSIRIPIYVGILLFEKYNALMELKRRKMDKGDEQEAKKCLEIAEKILKNETDSVQGKQLKQKIEKALFLI
jgi:SET domain